MLNKKAFTLIELLVVIAIIGILAGILISSMVSATNSANDARRKADINQIVKKLLEYNTSNQIYPTENCSIGLNCSETLNDILGSADNIKDPNGTFYNYSSSDGVNFVVSAITSDLNSYSYDSSSQQYLSLIPAAGVCGTANNKIYSYDITAYGSDSFCLTGNQSPVTPAFPLSGNSASWVCVGLNRGSNISCTASREDAPIADWILRSGVGTSASDNAGTTTGTINGAAWVVDNGNRLSFDGVNDYISVPDNTNWNIASGDFTISYWVKPASIGAIQWVVSQAISNDFYWFSRIEASGKIYFAYKNGDNTAQKRIDIPGIRTMSINNWYHILIVKSGNSWSQYINGSLDSSNSGSITPGDFAHSLEIGGATWIADQYAKGLIDNVRMYNQALSPTEIITLYDTQKTTHQ